MQLWQGREGEALTAMGGAVSSNLVAVRGRDGVVEILIPEPDRGETLEDVLEEAARRKLVESRRSHRELTHRKESP